MNVIGTLEEMEQRAQTRIQPRGQKKGRPMENQQSKPPARRALRWPNVALRPEAHERLRRAAHNRRCSMSDIILADVMAAYPAKSAAQAQEGGEG